MTGSALQLHHTSLFRELFGQSAAGVVSLEDGVAVTEAEGVP
jgi:hypothetical protein